MIINKKNIKTYLAIIRESKSKKEVFKYILKRIIGKREKFSRDVLIENKGMILNCGRIMEDCTVACSEFEREVSDVVRKITEGIFLDVGAHIGKHTILAARSLGKNGKVISIEANNTSANLLKKNVKLNNLKNVEVHNIACSDKNGHVNFYSNEFHPPTNSMTPTKGAKKTKVPSKTIDAIVGNHNGVKLIKLDVEGMEERVLSGAKKTIKRDKPCILFEAWTTENFNKVKSILEEYGYKYRKIDNVGNFFACAK